LRGPDLKTTNHARALRKIDNGAEGRLWQRLRNRQLHGVKFLRQLPIGPYFADFASRECRLVIEVDGSQHIGSVYDEIRNAFMTRAGWSVARFTYADVLNNMDDVLEALSAIFEGRITEPVMSREFQFHPAALPSSEDRAHMSRAIELARAQMGRTTPNPPVGCVIVRDGVVLSEAATGDGGRPHAEEAALAALGNRAENATAYVTLEPCAERSHGGLSCSQRLNEAGVSRVVYACADPSPYASHIGVQRMTQAGLRVESGLMADEARILIEDFVRNLPVKP